MRHRPNGARRPRVRGNWAFDFAATVRKKRQSWSRSSESATAPDDLFCLVTPVQIWSSTVPKKPKTSRPIEDRDAQRRRQLTAARRIRKSRRNVHRHTDRGGDDDDAISPHDFELFRPSRIARLLNVNTSTVWRWRKNRVLPAFIEIGGISGLTGAMLRKFLAERTAPQQPPATP
jgi:hypothetical protein